MDLAAAAAYENLRSTTKSNLIVNWVFVSFDTQSMRNIPVARSRLSYIAASTKDRNECHGLRRDDEVDKTNMAKHKARAGCVYQLEMFFFFILSISEWSLTPSATCRTRRRCERTLPSLWNRNFKLWSAHHFQYIFIKGKEGKKILRIGGRNVSLATVQKDGRKEIESRNRWKWEMVYFPFQRWIEYEMCCWLNSNNDIFELIRPRSVASVQYRHLNLLPKLRCRSGTSEHEEIEKKSLFALCHSVIVLCVIESTNDDEGTWMGCERASRHMYLIERMSFPANIQTESYCIYPFAEFVNGDRYTCQALTMAKIDSRIQFIELFIFIWLLCLRKSCVCVCVSLWAMLFALRLISMSLLKI